MINQNYCPATSFYTGHVVLSFINEYLQQQKKINDAFAALDTKITGVREQHKELLRKAGAVEARRLLGELSDEEAQTLDISLTQTREQQDRLSARETLGPSRPKTHTGGQGPAGF